jgi:hypothetical protein
MSPERPFSQELWEKIPAAVQDSIGTLEARVAALEAAVQRLEAMIQHVIDQLQQDLRSSSRPPASEPPQARNQWPRHEPSGRRPGGDPAMQGSHGGWCRLKRWMLSWWSNPRGVAVASSRCRGRMPHPSGVK